MVSKDGEISYSLSEDIDDEGEDGIETEPGDPRTLEEILAELQSQTGILKKGAPLSKNQQAQSKSSTASTANSKGLSEAVKRSQEARTTQLKGIRGRLDIISEQLGNLPEKMGQIKGGKSEGKKEEEQAKPKTAVESKKEATPKKEGETKKEENKWSKFTAENRKDHSMLRNEGTDKLDAHIGALRDQAASLSNTFHAIGMHSIGDKFGSLAADGGLLETLGAKLFLPALAVYGGLEIAGHGVEAIRNTRNSDINQSINGVEATGETVQNGIYDFLNKFGFSAVSGKDLTQFRNADLEQNWALFSEKGDAYFDALKTMTSHGWTTTEDKQFAQEMVAMGESADDVKQQFMDLSKTAAATGISFQNLSKTVAEEATSATKQLGKQAGEQVVKETPAAMEAMKSAGLVANQKTMDNLETNGEFKVAERMALIQMGYVNVSDHAQTPEVLLEETLAHGAFPLALQIFKQKEFQMSGGSEEQEASNLQAQGIQTTDLQTSVNTMYGQGAGPSAMYSPQNASTNHTLQVSISTSPELSAKVSKDNSYAEGIHGQWQSYYNVANYAKR